LGRSATNPFRGVHAHPRFSGQSNEFKDLRSKIDFPAAITASASVSAAVVSGVALDPSRIPVPRAQVSLKP